MAERVLPTRRSSRRVRLVFCATVLAALWLPGPAAAQELPSDGESVAPRPLELLVAHGAELGLTPAQLDRVNRIRERLGRTNEPLVRRMMTLRQQWQRQRLAARQNPARLERIRAAAEPVHARIQANNRTAMRAVNQVLTPSQRAQLRAIVEDRRRQDGVPAPGGSAADADADNRQ